MRTLVFLAACALGTGLHFLYGPLGRPRALRWLLPVSESPWEHTKLCFWPLCGGLAGVALTENIPLSAALWAGLGAGCHGVGSMLAIYYLYRAALGAKKPILWVDIGNFFVTMACAWPIGLDILAQNTPPLWPAALVLAAFAAVFQRISGHPPTKYPMFREENTNGRDQRSATA